MRRLTMVLAAVALLGGLVVSIASAAPPACTDTYSGSGDWSTAANWSTGKVPSASDVACWGSSQTLTVTTFGDTADSLQGGALSMSGGGLDLASASNDSSIGALTITGGALNADHPRTLTVAGDFDWNIPSGGNSAINSQGGPLTVAQTGTHSFKLEGQGIESMSSGTLSTPNPVSVSDPNLSPTNFPGPSLTTTSTITFAAGTYAGANFAITAAGIVTPTSAVSTQYSLHLTGSSSDVKGDLTLAGLSSDAGTTLGIPSGHVLTAGDGTISGAVNGLGGYVHDGNAQEVASGGSLSPATVTITVGLLRLDHGGTYAPSGPTTIGGSASAQLELDDNGSTGGLTLGDGTLTGTNGSVLTVAGDFDWNTPSGATSGINTSPHGLTVSQTGSHSFKIEGSGTAAIDGGSLTTPNPVQITDTNLSPGNFPGPGLTTTSTITMATGAYPGGNFTMSAAGIVTTGGAVSAQYSLDLTDSSSSLGGDLGLAALSVDAGKMLTIPSGDTVSAGGGTISGTVNGAGTFDQNGNATTVISGGTLSPGAVTASAGALTIDSGANYSPGSTTVRAPSPANPGRLEVDDNSASTGPLTITGGGFNGPSLHGSGKLTVAGDFDWNTPSGAVSGINDVGPNSLTVAQTGTHSFKIEGPGTESVDGGTLTTPNPVTISNPNFSPGNFPGPSLTTTSTATFTHAGTYPGGNLTLTAAGINLAAGDTTLPYTLDLTGGSTAIPKANSLTADQVNESGGTLQVDGSLSSAVSLSGGTLKGTGTLGGSLDNSGGTLAPGASPGTLTISGNYTQDAGGTLAEEITGKTPGTQFDQLIVDGGLSLDGTLAIDWHTFTPADSDTFKIITGASSRTGNFATVTGGTVGGQTFQAHGDSDGVTVEVPPPPAPADTAAPVISGTSTQGQALHTTNGTWDNNPTSFDYQWEDCDSAGNNCTNVGTDSSGYTLSGSDAGHTIRVVVSAHNLGGSDQATSDPTAVVKPLPPSNSAAPAISGTPAPGQALTCQNGSWSNNPAGFAYQWSRDGVSIPGATSQTYTVQPGDEGHALTCTVTASNAGGASSPASSAALNVPAAPPPAKPANTSPPTITGTPLPGNTLTCHPGTWDGNPTRFDYQWNRDTAQIPGATQQQYQVQIADEGHGLGCDVGAANGGGASSATASAPVIVAMKGTLTCPKPSGQISGLSVGPLTLGMRQASARGILTRFATTKNHFDDFCLFGGWGIRVGYRGLARGGKIVIALTANPFYSLGGVAPGAPLQAARSRLRLRKVFHIGLNDWYVIPRRAANGVLKVRHGVVQEIGLVNKRLTGTRRAQSRLLIGFR
jgi:fibronectin-binding autotransporter adhesin